MAYVERWFWSLDELASASGATPSETLALIAAGCAPGIVYARDSAGEWWSALGAYQGRMPPQPAEASRCYYAPAAAWGLRRAVLATRGGSSAAQAAEANRDDFAAAFRTALGPDARIAFPTCFADDGTLDESGVAAAARREWELWIAGVYAVCLRGFTAETCIRKETLGAMLKQSLAAGLHAPEEVRAQLAMAEELSLLVLPFAPWERPGGTPGLTIDRLLAEQALGDALPYR
jgi:hypothetical protein